MVFYMRDILNNKVSVGDFSGALEIACYGDNRIGAINTFITASTQYLKDEHRFYVLKQPNEKLNQAKEKHESRALNFKSYQFTDDSDAGAVNLIDSAAAHDSCTGAAKPLHVSGPPSATKTSEDHFNDREAECRHNWNKIYDINPKLNFEEYQIRSYIRKCRDFHDTLSSFTLLDEGKSLLDYKPLITFYLFTDQSEGCVERASAFMKEYQSIEKFRNAMVDYENSYHNNILLILAYFGRADMFKLCLDFFKKIKPESIKDFLINPVTGCNVLHLAAQSGYPSIFEILLKEQLASSLIHGKTKFGKGETVLDKIDQCKSADVSLKDEFLKLYRQCLHRLHQIKMQHVLVELVKALPAQKMKRYYFYHFWKILNTCYKRAIEFIETYNADHPHDNSAIKWKGDFSEYLQKIFSGESLVGDDLDSWQRDLAKQSLGQILKYQTINQLYGYYFILSNTVSAYFKLTKKQKIKGLKKAITEIHNKEKVDELVFLSQKIEPLLSSCTENHCYYTSAKGQREMTKFINSSAKETVEVLNESDKKGGSVHFVMMGSGWLKREYEWLHQVKSHMDSRALPQEKRRKLFITCVDNEYKKYIDNKNQPYQSFWSSSFDGVFSMFKSRVAALNLADEVKVTCKSELSQVKIDSISFIVGLDMDSDLNVNYHRSGKVSISYGVNARDVVSFLTPLLTSPHSIYAFITLQLFKTEAEGTGHGSQLGKKLRDKTDAKGKLTQDFIEKLIPGYCGSLEPLNYTPSALNC
jgi:hypothetical protein